PTRRRARQFGRTRRLQNVDGLEGGVFQFFQQGLLCLVRLDLLRDLLNREVRHALGLTGTTPPLPGIDAWRCRSPGVAVGISRSVVLGGVITVDATIEVVEGIRPE